MRPLITTTFCSLVLAIPAWAQSETKTPPAKETKSTESSKKGPTQDPKKVKVRVIPGGLGYRRAGLIDENGRPVNSRAEAKMNAIEAGRADAARKQADPTDGNTKPMRGDHLFSPAVYLRPRRLAPGERGVLHVVVTLGKGSLVVLPSSTAELRLVVDTVALKLGLPLLSKAPKGRTATKYKGTPVFEDAFRFEVPITIDASAAVRDYTVKGVVRLFLHDGTSGDPQGLFVADVEGSVSVGASLPNGGAAGDARAKGIKAVSDLAKSASREANGPSSSQPGLTKPKGRSRGRGAVEDVARESSDPDSGSPEGALAESGANLLYWVFGVVAALGLLIFLRRR